MEEKRHIDASGEKQSSYASWCFFCSFSCWFFYLCTCAYISLLWHSCVYDDSSLQSFVLRYIEKNAAEKERGALSPSTVYCWHLLKNLLHNYISRFVKRIQKRARKKRRTVDWFLMRTYLYTTYTLFILSLTRYLALHFSEHEEGRPYWNQHNCCPSHVLILCLCPITSTLYSYNRSLILLAPQLKHPLTLYLLQLSTAMWMWQTPHFHFIMEKKTIFSANSIYLTCISRQLHRFLCTLLPTPRVHYVSVYFLA